MGFASNTEFGGLDDLARLTSPRQDGEAPLYLGPARVLSVDGDEVRVVPSRRAAGEPVTAVMAMAMRYEPVPGDVLLIIGRGGEEHYAIGVIFGQGMTTLVAQGDVALTAPMGRIEISAARGVAVRGAALDVECDAVTVTTNALSEYCHKAMRWVSGLLDVRAGQASTVVDGVHQVKAKHIVEVAEEQVRLDGAQIHLG